MISGIGATFLILGVATLVLRARWFPVVIAASAALPTTAALTFGENSVPPFFLLAILATLSAVHRSPSRERGQRRNETLLTLFVVWSLLVTAISPSLFRGLGVLESRGGIDQQVLDPTPLDYQISMLAQCGYLIVGVGTAIYLGRRRILHPSLLTTTFLVGSVFSAGRLWVPSQTTFDYVFRNYASIYFNPWETRNPGVFIEPSILATFSIAGLAYCVFRFPSARIGERAALVVTVSATIVNLITSASGTAAVSLVILAVIGAIIAAYRFLLRRSRFPVPILICIPFVVAALVIPNPLTGALIEIIDGKIGSLSQINRLAADELSVGLIFDTFGIGVGLGGNRPSSFIALIASNTGIVGIALFSIAVASIVARSLSNRPWHATVASLIALLVAKSVAEPNLNTPLLWLALGALLFAGRSDVRQDESRQHLSAGARAKRAHFATS